MFEVSTLTLADFDGRTVLLEFWATWCGPCIADAPGFVDLYARTDRDDFEILGIALDYPADVTAFSETYGMTWPQTVEPNRNGRPMTTLFGVRGYPTSVVIGPDGRIVYRGQGGGADVVAAVDAALDPE